MGEAVLVVDDEPSIREMLAEELRGHGFQPTAMSNGWEALRYLQNGGPARVIVLDLMMPVMDGWIFRREQRADRRLAGIPVVVVTASELRRIEELEADVVLRKPIKVHEVVGVVRELVRTPSRLVS